MNTKYFSACLFGAVAFGASVSAQTAFDPSYDTDIIAVGDTYNVTGPVSIGVNAEVVIDRPVFVTEGGSLAIAEGAVLRFQPSDGSNASGYLCISSDGTINAVGTSTNPVILTTAAAPDGSRWVSGSFMDSDPRNAPMVITSSDQLNLWGGLIVLGNAPINAGAVDIPDGAFYASPGVAKIEGVGGENGARVYYGGINPNDNSGTVKYVSIRYSGQIIADGDEIQGLTLGGVGYGTTLDYIEVYGSGDDGIEVFGGTASFKHMVLSNFDDDGFDLDQGYTGFAQFGLVVASSASGVTADNLFEMDGDDDIPADENNVSADGRPFGYAQISNFTLIGSSTMSGVGMRLRQGFGGDITNTIVANVPGKGLRIDNNGNDEAAAAGYPSALSQDRAAAGTLNIASVSFYGVASDTAATIGYSAFDVDVVSNVTTTAPGAVNNLIGALTVPRFGNNGTYGSVSGTAPFNPVPFSSAVSVNPAPYGAMFFTKVTYRGAFERSPTLRMWTTGWTALNKTGLLVGNGINSL